MIEIRKCEWRKGSARLAGDCRDGRFAACFSATPRQQAEAFAALAPMLISFFGRRIRTDRADLEDLAQETLAAAHRRKDAYDPRSPFLAWLFGIARHKLSDHLRRARPSVPLDALEDGPEFESFERRSHARLDIERLLDRLPHKQFISIHETWLVGRTAAEAGGRWGLSEGAVRVSAHRGLKQLAADVAASEPV